MTKETLEQKTEMEIFYNEYIRDTYGNKSKKKEKMKEKLLELPYDEKKKFVEEMMTLNEDIGKTYRSARGTKYDITHQSLEKKDPYERKETIRGNEK